MSRAVSIVIALLLFAGAAAAQGPSSRGGSATNEPTLPGEGIETRWSPSFHPPGWLVVGIAALAVGGVVGLYLSERGTWSLAARMPLAALRIAAIGLLLWMWHGWSSQTFRTDLPEILVAIDVSESMSTVDAGRAEAIASALRENWGASPPTGANRLATALTFLTESRARPLARLADDYRLRVYLIGASVRPVDLDVEGGAAAALAGLEPRDPSSALADGVRELLEMHRGRSTAAILLATDGVVTRGGEWTEAGEVARARNVPLYFWALGDDESSERPRIVDLAADPVVFVGDRVTFEVRAQGLAQGGGARAVLRRKGERETLAETPIEGGQGIAGEGTATLEFEPQEPGEIEFEVELESAAGSDAGEPSTEESADARRTVAVQVRDETIRVLYVQGYPSWEFRHLKDALARQRKPNDPEARTFDLDVVLQDADLGYARTDEDALSTLPTSRDELFAYDVVILGDVSPSYLGRPMLENLRRFVEERGGGLVLSAGPRSLPWDYRQSALAPLFPFDPSTVTPLSEGDLAVERQVVPTRLGLTTPQMQIASTPAASQIAWSRLPGLRWYVPLRSLRPGARPLAELVERDGSNDPTTVIAMEYFGAGKTIFVGTDETWLWRLRSGEEAYRQFWTRTVRYLARSRLLGTDGRIEIAADRGEYRFGEAVKLRARFFDERQAPAEDDGVALVVTGEDGARRTVRLSRPGADRGEFVGGVDGLPAGAYRALLVTPATGAAPPATTFAILPPPGELARVRTDLVGMRTAATRSGGGLYREPDFAKALDELPSGRAVRVDASRPIPFWNHWIVAAIFVTLLTTEWILRRFAGML